MSKRKKGWGLFDASSEESKDKLDTELEKQNAIKEKAAQLKVKQDEQAALLERRKSEDKKLAEQKAEEDAKKAAKLKADQQEQAALLEKRKAEDKKLADQRAKEDAEKAAQLKLEQEEQATLLEKQKAEDKKLADRKAEEKKAKELEEKRLKEETAEKKRLADLEAKKQQEEKVREEKQKGNSIDNKNSSSSGQQEKGKSDDDSNNKWLLILLLLVGISGGGYLISCNYFGYCFKTAITDIEIENYQENGLPGKCKIGDVCSDENPNTERDRIISQDCECQGTLVGQPTIEYDCPSLNKNIGDACDDEDSTTTNDRILTEDCDCKGVKMTTPQPAKSFDCSALNKNIGDKCDDGNLNTENDVITGNCDCVGSSKVVAASFDCPSFRLNYGDPCPSDQSKRITIDCECEGANLNAAPFSSSSVGSADSDNDGVNDSIDECPTRIGTKESKGCPELSISLSSNELLVNQKGELKSSLNEGKPGDKYVWSSKAQIDSPSSKSTFVGYDYVGKVGVQVSVRNDNDNFALTKEKTIHFKITEEMLKEYLIKLADYGNFSMSGRTKEIDENKRDADDFMKNSVLNDLIKLKKLNRGIVVNRKSWKDFRLELLTKKMSLESKIDANSLQISELKYDEVTGKISSFKYSYK